MGRQGCAAHYKQYLHFYCSLLPLFIPACASLEEPAQVWTTPA